MKAVVLLSDGIDSPVAARMMHDLGLKLTFLHCLNSTDTRATQKVRKIVDSIDKKAEIVHVNHILHQEKIKANCNTRFQCILCKRAMYQEAEKLARKINASYIVTGESLGQVASQTLENMFVLDCSVKIPVLRPLIGFDKNEIIARAREYGTYDISTMISADCAYVPRNPSTRSILSKIEHEEAKWKKARS